MNSDLVPATQSVNPFLIPLKSPLMLTNMNLDGDGALQLLSKIRTDPGRRMDDCLNTVIQAVSVASYEYEFVHEPTGEIRTARNYVIVHPDDSYTTFTSLQAWSNLCMIVEFLRDPGPWKPPLRLRVVSRALDAGRRLHGFQFDGRG